MRLWQGVRCGWRPALCAAAAWCLVAPAAPAAEPVTSLAAGEKAFWAGPFVGSGRVDDPGACNVEGPCFEYPIRVRTAHATLRVAIDSTDETNGWGLRLLDPDGHEVARDTTYQEGGLGERNSLELFAHDAAPGLWTAEVVAQDVVSGEFRARAALIGASGPAAAAPAPASAPATRRRARHRTRRASPWRRCRRHHTVRHCVRARRHKARAAGAGVHDVLPDIAPDPPWHLTFQQPLPQVLTEGGNVTALAGVHNPTAEVGGQPVYTCLPEETIEQAGRRCLRFASGVGSLGPGQFEVFGAAPVPVAAGGGPLYQVVHRSDGSTTQRPAGQFIFHQVHLHYHVLDLAEFPLFRVGADHALTPAGAGLKEGFCLGNSKIFDWSSFAQAEVDPNTIDNCEPSPHPDQETQLPDGSWRFYEGIANGWEDVYTWATSGQFVDFGANPDGEYLLRMIVNPRRTFLESDYSNDTAYVLFSVTGHEVQVIERGRGSDPWDPHRQVLDPVITR
jgi:Lysyl oxidase